MTTTRRRRIVLLLAAAVLLPGCSVLGAAEPRVTRLPTDARATPSPSATAAPGTTAATPAPPSGDVVECGGGSILITAGSPSTLVGECPEVEVQGSDLTVDTTGATVAIMRVSGDRAGGMLGDVGQLTIAGNDSVLAGSRISSLTIRGDRNAVSASGGFEGVLLQGNDNAVAGSVGQLSDEGARNTVG